MKSFLVSSAAALVLTAVSFAGADPVGGEQNDRDVIVPSASITYTVALYAKQETAISVSGDGDGDIDCYVVDGDGEILVRDTRAADGCLITFVPYATKSYRIVLRNTGDEVSAYRYRVW